MIAHKSRFNKIIYKLLTMRYALRSLFQTKFSLMKVFNLNITVKVLFRKKQTTYLKKIPKINSIWKKKLISDQCYMLCSLVFGWSSYNHVMNIQSGSRKTAINMSSGMPVGTICIEESLRYNNVSTQILGQLLYIVTNLTTNWSLLRWKHSNFMKRRF